MNLRWAWLPGLVTALGLTACRFEEETPIQN